MASVTEYRNQFVSNAPHVEEVSGRTASFETDIRGKVKSCEVEFTPTQDLHGQSGPYPPGASHNKLEPNRNVPTTINGVTIAYENDGRFYFNGKATDAFTFRIDNWESVPKLIPHGEGQLKLGFKASVENTPTGVNYFSVYYHINGGYGMGQQIWFTQSIGMLIPNLTLEDEVTVESKVSIPKNTQCNNFSIGIMMTVDNNSSVWVPYENECPIAGVTNVVVRNDKYYPGQIMWNQLCDFSENGGWVDPGMGFTHSWDNGVLTVSSEYMGNYGYYYPIKEVKGHTFLYIVRGYTVRKEMSYGRGEFEIPSGMHSGVSKYLPYDVLTEISGTISFSYDMSNRIQFLPGQDGTMVISSCMWFDLTQMFGAGNEPTYEEFRAMFPADYYPYDAGTRTTVTEVRGETLPQWIVQFGQTCYGGKLDLNTGKAELTWALFDVSENVTRLSSWYNYDIEHEYDTLGFYAYRISQFKVVPPEAKNYTDPTGHQIASNLELYRYGAYNTNTPWIFRISASGNDQYLGFRIPISALADTSSAAAAQESALAWLKANQTTVCYELETPIILNLTPQQITTLKGSNNFFSDAGNMTIKYWTH